ncbi:MAG TPA: Coq4 family protein [Crinalium sp.]
MLNVEAELSPDVVKVAQGIVALVNNPGQTDAVFDIADGLRHTEVYQHFIQYAHSQPAVAEILKERYFAPPIDLDALLNYPEDSLGHRYAAAMKAANLVPDFYRKINVEDDYSYIALRMRQTHDIWHIITGFGTDLAGELALQAFTLAQTHSPLAVALLAAIVMHVIKVSGPVNHVVDAIQAGWQMGIKAQPFLAQKWEDDWEKSVSAWRTDVGIETSE